MKLDREGLLKIICKLGDYQAHSAPSYLLVCGKDTLPPAHHAASCVAGLNTEEEGAGGCGAGQELWKGGSREDR